MRLQDLNKKLVKVEKDREAVLVEVHEGSKSVEELELALQGVIQDQETIIEIGNNVYNFLTNESGSVQVKLMDLVFGLETFGSSSALVFMKLILYGSFFLIQLKPSHGLP